MRDVELRDDMSGADSMVMRAIDLCDQGRVDTVILWLGEEDELINIWEVPVTKLTGKKVLWDTISEIGKHIERLENV